VKPRTNTLTVAPVQGGGVGVYGSDGNRQVRALAAPVLVDGKNTRKVWIGTIATATAEEALAWNPALHPRGSDGKFVERPFKVPSNLIDTFENVGDIPAEEIVSRVDLPDDVRIDGFNDDDVSTDNLANDPEEGANTVIRALEESDGIDGDTEEIRERWADALRGGFDNPDEELQKAVVTAQSQVRDNDEFQDLIDGRNVSDEAMVIEPSLANAEGSGNITFQELAQAERKAGVSFVYENPNGTKSTDPVTPQAGDSVSSKDVASILRHEMAHDLWDRADRDFRQWFQSEYRGLSDGAITGYADERGEEGFTELITVSTNPKYDPAEFDDSVSALAEDVKNRIRSERFGVNPEDVSPELPGTALDANEISIGDSVGVMETDTGDVRTGEVVDKLPREGEPPLVEVQVGEGRTTLAGDSEDEPRRLFDAE